MRVELESKFDIGDTVKFHDNVCTVIKIKYDKERHTFRYLLDFADEERMWVYERNLNAL